MGPHGALGPGSLGSPGARESWVPRGPGVLGCLCFTERVGLDTPCLRGLFTGLLYLVEGLV